MGNRFSSAEKDIDKTAKQIIKKNKEVSFPENPLTETWSQSPRTSDEFYNFNSKTDANHSQKKTRTTKEKREKQRTRSRAIKGNRCIRFYKRFQKIKTLREKWWKKENKENI